MDKNEDKTPSAIPPAGDPAAAATPLPAGPVAGEPAIEAKIDLASIESPPMAPEMTDMVAAASGLGMPKAELIDRPIPNPPGAEKIEEIKPQRSHDAAPGAHDIIPFGAPAAGRSSRRFSRFTVLAATVVLAAAFGATAGVLAATGLTRLAGAPVPVAPPPAAEPPALQATLTQLRSEVAALKASVEATGRSSGAQYSKLVERFDRVERAQSAGGKSDAALPKENAKDAARETTGSITPPSVAAAPLAPVPAPLAVPGWAVRDVYRGVAMLQSRLGGMVEVEPGDVLPGLGRIEAIRRQDGRWVVVTSKGTITSLR